MKWTRINIAILINCISNMKLYIQMVEDIFSSMYEDAKCPFFVSSVQKLDKFFVKKNKWL